MIASTRRTDPCSMGGLLLILALPPSAACTRCGVGTTPDKGMCIPADDSGSPSEPSDGDADADSDSDSDSDSDTDTDIEGEVTDDVGESVIDGIDWSDVSELDGDSPWRHLATYVGYFTYPTSRGYARCTASLVSRTLVVTNNHCVSGHTDFRINFDYLRDSDYDSWTALYDDAYVCADVVASSEDEDVALVECAASDNDGHVIAEDLGGYIELELDRPSIPDEDDAVFLLHQNCERPDEDASCGWESDDAYEEATKKLSPGVVSELPTGDYDVTDLGRFDGSNAVLHTADTLGGTSGALVFNSTYEVVGVHHAGSSDGNHARLLDGIVDNVDDFKDLIEADLETSPSTTCTIEVEPAEDTWTDSFTPDTACTCSSSDTSCHALYQGRVDAITGNAATMSFKKASGGSPSVDVSWWVVVGEDEEPSCEDINAFVSRAEGTWSSGESVLTVSGVDIWKTEEDYEAAADGDDKKLFVITGGSDGPDERIWFQRHAFVFTKRCD